MVVLSNSVYSNYQFVLATHWLNAHKWIASLLDFWLLRINILYCTLMRLFNRVLETLNLDLKSLGIESLQEEQVE